MRADEDEGERDGRANRSDAFTVSTRRRFFLSCLILALLPASSSACGSGGAGQIGGDRTGTGVRLGANDAGAPGLGQAGFHGNGAVDRQDEKQNAYLRAFRPSVAQTLGAVAVGSVVPGASGPDAEAVICGSEGGPEQTGGAEQGPSRWNVEIFRRVRRGGFFIYVSNGLGPEFDRELVAYTDLPHPNIAEVLLRLGCEMRRAMKDGKPWQPYDEVALTEPLHNVQYFGLSPAGEVEMTGGLVVRLVKVTPLAATEYTSREGWDSKQWFDADGVDPDGRERALRRWQVVSE